MKVPASWAVWGKNQGDQGEYRLLASSTGSGPTLEAMLRTYQPGTPGTADTGHAGSLPWFTVGPDHPGGRTLLALVDWSGDQDRSGRPVTSTGLLLVPSSAVVEAGHLSLYRACSDQVLPPARGVSQVTLSVEPHHDDRERPDPLWCAGVAAMLLEDRVVITEADPGDAGARLVVVDAVLRLLPAGYRADLSVATWVNTPDQRPHRMCFGPYAGNGLAEVRYGRTPTPRSEPARRYLALVTRYLAQEGEETLVEFLQSRAGPYSFDDGLEAAIAIVAELSVPDTVVAEIRRGDGVVTRTAQALSRYGPDAFAADVDVVYRFLLTAEPLEDEVLEVLIGCWSASLLHTVVAVTRTSSEAGRGRLASAFVDAAERAGDLDEYLTAMLVPDGREVPANLVQVCVETHFTCPGEHPQLRGLLLANVGVGTAVVLECRDSRPDRLLDLLEWMADGVLRKPPWLRVLLAAAADTERIHSDVTASALRQSPSVAQVAFDIAAVRNRLSAMDDALWGHLVTTMSSAAPRDPARRLLSASAVAIVGTVHAPAERALLDLLLVAGGDRPLAVPGSPDAAWEYAHAQHSIIDRLGAVGPAVSHDRTAASVVRALREAEADLEVIASYVASVSARTQHRRSPLLAGLLIGELTTAHGPELLAALDRTGRWWLSFACTDVGLAEVAMDVAVRSGPTDLVARHWAAVVLSDGRPSPVVAGLRRLAAWPQLTRPDELATLVRATAAVIRQLGGRDDWEETAIMPILEGFPLGGAAAVLMADSHRRLAFEDEAACRRELAHLDPAGAAPGAERRATEARRKQLLARIAAIKKRTAAIEKRTARSGFDRRDGSTVAQNTESPHWRRVLADLGSFFRRRT